MAVCTVRKFKRAVGGTMALTLWEWLQTVVVVFSGLVVLWVLLKMFEHFHCGD